MKKGHAKPKGTGNRAYCVKSAAVSCLWGGAVAAALLSLFAVLLSARDLPLLLCRPVAVLAILAGCCTAGFLCGRMLLQHGMVWGGVCGAALFLCLLLAQGISAGGSVGLAALPKFVMMLTSGMLGGVFGVNAAGR